MRQDTLNALLWAIPAVRPVFEAALAHIDRIKLHLATDQADFLRRLPEAEVVLLPNYNYKSEIVEALHHKAPALRWLQMLNVGYDLLEKNPPPPYLRITNAGNSMAPAMAEHVLALLLALARRLPESLANQAHAHWEPAIKPRIRLLSGATLVIVGYGAVGREIARRARAFGMYVIGVRRTSGGDEPVDEMVAPIALDQALGRADAIAITAPLTAQTRAMFDARRFARCKPGGWFINVARGEIVDTLALAEALHSGRIGGAGLDVTAPEPPPPEHPIWKAPNLIVTPHVSATDSNPRLALFVAENMRRYLADEALQAIIDPHAR